MLSLPTPVLHEGLKMDVSKFCRRLLLRDELRSKPLPALLYPQQYLAKTFILYLNNGRFLWERELVMTFMCYVGLRNSRINFYNSTTFLYQ